jgi:hypothetical protein
VPLIDRSAGHILVSVTCLILIGFVIGVLDYLRLSNRLRKAAFVAAAQEEIDVRQIYREPIYD